MRKQGSPARRTPSRNPQTDLIGTLAAIWQQLSDIEKSLWNQANARLFNPKDPSKLLKGPTGYTCFVAVNSNRASLQMPVTQSVPSDMTPGFAMPPCRIEITFPGIGGFSAKLIPNYAIPAGQIIVHATPSTPIGNTTWKPSSYRKIGLITSAVPTAGLEIGDLLLSVYPKPGMASQIGFKFTPVSAHGVSNTNLFVTGLTPLDSANAATETGDTDKNAKDLHLA